jgi:hypothetical protein
MRSVNHLDKLRKVATRRCAHLKCLISDLRPPLGPQDDRLIAYTTLETLNLWASFCRAFYLSVALGAKDCSGTRVNIPGGLRAPSDAIHFAVTKMRPWKKRVGPPWTRNDEPTWHDPNTLITLLSSLSTSNLSDIQAALSYQTDVFSLLPSFRNFFAHRNEETAGKIKTRARALGFSPALRACEILCTSHPGRPQNVLSDWLDDLIIVINLMCH